MKQAMTYYLPVDQTTWEVCQDLAPTFPLQAGQKVKLPDIQGFEKEYEVLEIRGNLVVQITDDWDATDNIILAEDRFYLALAKWSALDPLIGKAVACLKKDLQIIAKHAKFHSKQIADNISAYQS